MTRPTTNDNGTDREMTQNEYDAYLVTVEAVQAQVAAEQAAAEQAAAAKQSARAKLAALGLTDEEITALIGA